MVVENSELRLHLVQQFCDIDILLILVKLILFAYIFMQDCLYNCYVESRNGTFYIL